MEEVILNSFEGTIEKNHFINFKNFWDLIVS